MAWDTNLHNAGVSIHVIATGAGAGIQQELWALPGSSSYLSGCSFPYATEETEELLGFRPTSFCSEDTAIDLASAAYMKAFRIGGKDPIGVGVTASVASEREHRGEHRVHICTMTNNNVWVFTHVLDKGVGKEARFADGCTCDALAHTMILYTIQGHKNERYTDATSRALARFLERPCFAADGQRLAALPDNKKYGLMSGAFNPPHEGHFGAEEAFIGDTGKKLAFEVTAAPPHKEALTVQELLKRAKMLQGHNRLFTTNLPLYLDKARAYPGSPLVLGSDAVLRMLDPKWGVEIGPSLQEFKELGTRFFVMGRNVDNKWPYHGTTQFVTALDIVKDLPDALAKYGYMFNHLDGRWDISSSELRNKANG